MASKDRRVRFRGRPFFSDRPPGRLVRRIRLLDPLLDPAERVSFAERMDRVRGALLFDRDFRLQTDAARSNQLAIAVKNGDHGAMPTFIEFHAAMVRAASRMLVVGFNLAGDDAWQTAIMSLLEAAHRFDAKRRYAFFSRARRWVRRACERYGSECGMSMRVPEPIFGACFRLMSSQARLVAAFGEEGAKERFERRLADSHVLPKQWSGFTTARRVRLFSELDEGEYVKLDRPDHSTLDAEARLSIREEIQFALEALKPREAQVLKMRYGIGEPARSPREVADELNLTGQRIRQIEDGAKKKLGRAFQETRRRNDRLKRSDHQIRKDRDSGDDAERTGGGDDAQNQRITAKLNRYAPHSLIEDFAGKHPIGYILDGQAVLVKNWLLLFERVCRQLVARDEDRFRALNDYPEFINNHGALVAGDPAALRKPLRLGRVLYIETHRLAANSIRDITRGFLAVFQIPVDRMQIFLRDRWGAMKARNRRRYPAGGQVGETAGPTTERRQDEPADGSAMLTPRQVETSCHDRWDLTPDS